MRENTISRRDVCTVTNDPGHDRAHDLVYAMDLDVLECADIELIAHLMCELGDKAQTSDCHLLYLVVLSLNCFNPAPDCPIIGAIEYWQDKSTEWFPEYYTPDDPHQH